MRQKRKSWLTRWRAQSPLLQTFCWAQSLTLVALGVLLWGGFNWSMELTNTETFCISCHEMRNNVYPEYRDTRHFTNRTGVRATCPDCHVPREWGYKVVRKIKATNELYHHFMGHIDTPEKFNRRRAHLARTVWRSMQETDSRECRNCHHFDFMDAKTQSEKASERHRLGNEQGKTCIDCHISIAHKLPEDLLDTEHERYKREKVPCKDCHVSLPGESAEEDWDWEREEDWDAGT